MAKTYDFEITLQRATIHQGMVSFSLIPGTADLLHHECYTGTFNDALARRAALSQTTPQTHVAHLRMRYRDDRQPPLFRSRAKYLIGGV